jgi:hypothetical protein
MSENKIRIDYDFKKVSELYPSSIDAEELAKLRTLHANVQEKIKIYKDYIYEADNLAKHLTFVNRAWLDESIATFEKNIRELESFYK